MIRVRASKRARKHTRVVRVLKQRGRSIKSLDKKKRAMRPGKRITAHGTVYWETRTNASDKVPTKKL